MAKPTRLTWVTRDGQRIRVADMTTSHLVNTIALLRRNVERDRLAELQAAQVALNMVRGELAIDYCERCIEHLEAIDADDLLMARVPCFETMLEEIGKRGVDVGS